MSKLTGGIFTSLGVLAIVAMGALGIVTIMFIPKIASMVYPYLMALTGLGVGLVIIMLPFTFFTRLRSGIATTTLVVSYVIGAGFWSYSAIVAYKIWGMTGLITGLVFAGVGVVPVAFLACVFNAEWMVILNIVFAAFLTFGTRVLSFYIMSKALSTNTPLRATNANPTPKPQGNILDEMLGGPAKPAEITPVSEVMSKPVGATSVIILPYNPAVQPEAPTTAINVNVVPKPQGNILEEMLKINA